MPLLPGKSVVALACALAALALADSGHAGQQQRPVSIEYDVDRPGLDYLNFEIRDANPQTCRTRCANDGKCAAYTFVKAGIQGRFARCYLKSAVPQRRSDRCCISGVKQR